MVEDDATFVINAVDEMGLVLFEEDENKENDESDQKF